MKEFKVLKRAVKVGEILTDADFVTWGATAWGVQRTPNGDGFEGVLVRRAANSFFAVTHEDEIEGWIPDAPDDLKTYVRAEILKHRPEGEDEVRDPSTGMMWQLKWDDNSKRARNLSTESTWYRHEYFSGSELNARAEAWFEKNKPAPKLASNQVLAEDEASPIELRWHEGKPEGRYAGENSPWFTWKLGGTWCKSADAWFRANCPIDRFVTDEGEVLEFRLDENTGEAYCEGWGVTSQTFRSASEVPERYSDLGKAVYRFRDAERAKLNLEYVDSSLGGYVRIFYGLRCRGFYNGSADHAGGGFSLAPGHENYPPTWVRARAKAMWEERGKEWETRWYPQNQDGESVEVFLNGSFAGRLTRAGRPSETRHGLDWPPHILAQARAKFRENYQLKPNEIWKRGEVVKLEWDGRMVMFPVCAATSGQWDAEERRDLWLTGLSWADEAERLAAYDRCCAFYCENAEDAYLWKRGLLAFTMVGDIGHAKIGTSTVWTSDHLNSRAYPEDEFRGREKLRAWTAKQLAARKVTFEAFTVHWENELDKDMDSLVSHKVSFVCDHEGSVGFVKAVRDWRKVRFTIEPAGES